MGEHAYRGKECVKIAVMDEAFWARAELLAAQENGWGASPDTRLGCAVDELALLLQDESTLYALPPRQPRPFDMNYSDPPINVALSGPIDLAGRLNHKKMIAWLGEYKTFIYRVPCLYTSEGRLLHGAAPDTFKFVAIGERYRQGVPRTIFACASCGALFSLPAEELARIDQTACYTETGERWLTFHPKRGLE